MITWLKGETKLKVNDHVLINTEGELFIKGLAEGDNGVYTCEASNDRGADRKQVEITVQEPITEAPGKSLNMLKKSNFFSTPFYLHLS